MHFAQEVVVVGAFLGFVFFILSFFAMKVGLAIMTIAMLFSPEIAVGSVGLRAITLRIEDFLIPILLLAWLAQTATKQGMKLITPTPLTKPIGFLILLMIGSSIFGYVTHWVYPFPALFYTAKTVQYFVIFFLVSSYVKTVSQVRLFIFFTLLTVAMVGAYTIVQVPSVEIFTENRITAPFEGEPEPATVGGYMAFLLLIMTSLFLFTKSGFKKYLYLALCVLVFIPFLYTLNRTSYAAFFIGFMFITFMAKRRWLTILGALVILSSPLTLPEEIKSRIAFTWEDAKNERRTMGVDMSFEERIYQFKKMWNSFKKSPIIGWGVTSFDTPDSQYARTLHEIGVLGLWLWLLIFYRLYRVSRWLFENSDDDLKGFALGYCAGLFGLLLHGFGAITFYIVRIMEPFWFVSGLVMALYLIRVREIQEEDERNAAEWNVPQVKPLTS